MATPPYENGPRFLVSVDYGTTFTGVAWVLTTGDAVQLSDINVVQNWPGDIGPKVPSLLTYSANVGQQWGYGIGDNAYVIRWTKLELEPPLRVDALQALKDTLLEATQLGFNKNMPRNQIPRHLIRTSADIMTDYLREVAICVRQDIKSKKDPETLNQFPMDFVITHPAIWDPRAKNITFRAVNEAFRLIFPEIETRPGIIRLASEPEACAQYTMRIAQEEALENLRQGECFVVVDAGGGTVDLVSYRVDEVFPNFRVTRVTQVSGGGYGATRVDEHFLTYFLRQRLSPQDYNKLMAIGTRAERHGHGSHTVLRRGEQIMLKKFEVIKQRFAGPPPPGQPVLDDAIELPPGIGQQDNPANNIRDGQLFITCADLEEMFKVSVEGTLDLIHQQLVQVDRLRLRVRTIFLSGGFSRSQYLYNRVNDLARQWRFNLVRGEDSWTAVAKGAALMGLGIGCTRPRPVLRCPCHIGVVVSKRFAEYDHKPEQRYTDTFDMIDRAKDDIKWVIARGDLVTEDGGIQKKLKIVKKITSLGRTTGRVTIVHSEFGGPGAPPTHLSDATDSTRQEVHLDYDLSIVPVNQQNIFMGATNTQTGMSYRKVEMQVEITVSQAVAEILVLWGKEEGMLGTTGAPGYLLASYTIPFPEASAMMGY